MNQPKVYCGECHRRMPIEAWMPLRLYGLPFYKGIKLEDILIPHKNWSHQCPFCLMLWLSGDNLIQRGNTLTFTKGE